MYKAIFIDIDDTLLDYIPCCREAFDAAIGELKIKNEELKITVVFGSQTRLAHGGGGDGVISGGVH